MVQRSRAWFAKRGPDRRLPAEGLRRERYNDNRAACRRTSGIGYTFGDTCPGRAPDSYQDARILARFSTRRDGRVVDGGGLENGWDRL